MPSFMALLIILALESVTLAQNDPRGASPSHNRQDVPPGRDQKKDVAVVLPLVRKCFYEHWYASIAKLESNDLVVVVTIRLDFRPDGTLVNEPKVMHPIARPDFARLVDAALKDVHKCVPLKNVPPETYYIWKAVVLHFVPNKAAGEAAAHAYRANQYVAMGQFDRAIANYSRAIKSAPKPPSTITPARGPTSKRAKPRRVSQM